MDDLKEWKLGSDELYFKWLIKRLNVPEEETNMKRLGELDLKKLGTIPFKYTIHTDYNREFDAKKLRTEYYGEDLPDYILKSPASVLEVLVGLSIRMCEEVLGDDTSWDLFCLMLLNLGIYNKDVVGSTPCRGWCHDEDIPGIVDKWLNREFDFNGVGSPFPLKRNDEGLDQRKIDIWQQLSLYLDEIKYSEED